MPLEEIAKLLPTALLINDEHRITISFSKAFIVEIMLSDASVISSIPSPTFLYTMAASAIFDAFSIEYPSLAKSAVAVTTSETVVPRDLARETDVD